MMRLRVSASAVDAEMLVEKLWEKADAFFGDIEVELAYDIDVDVLEEALDMAGNVLTRIYEGTATFVGETPDRHLPEEPEEESEEPV